MLGADDEVKTGARGAKAGEIVKAKAKPGVGRFGCKDRAFVGKGVVGRVCESKGVMISDVWRRLRNPGKGRGDLSSQRLIRASTLFFFSAEVAAVVVVVSRAKGGRGRVELDEAKKWMMQEAGGRKSQELGDQGRGSADRLG